MLSKAGITRKKKAGKEETKDDQEKNERQVLRK